MTNLRELAEMDLADTLEDPKNWGLPVVLKDPDGVEQNVNGQILYDTIVENPATGGEMIVHKPVVTVRRSSLSRVPVPGEKWSVQIPITPDPEADKVTYLLGRPSEDGGSLGFIRLYLIKAEQEAP